MILSNHTNRLYCRHCLALKIQDYFSEAKVFDGSCFGAMEGIVINKCDWTDANCRVIGGIMQYCNPLAKKLDLDIRFGSQYWNGHYASQGALVAGLLSPDLQYQTGVLSYRNGKSVYIDQNGIALPANFVL